MFCSRLNNLSNLKTFVLELIGAIDQDNDYYKIAYKYIRNVSHWKSCDWNNYFLKMKTEIILYLTHENHFRKIQRETHQSAKIRFTCSPTTDIKEALWLLKQTILVLRV
jgi:hypothetical protein